jgi:hypothetical protein
MLNKVQNHRRSSDEKGDIDFLRYRKAEQEYNYDGTIGILKEKCEKLATF